MNGSLDDQRPRVPLRVAIDATSLLGARTGVGTMTRALIERLVRMPDLAVTGVLVSLRGRNRLAAELPAGVNQRTVTFPARLSRQLWVRWERPALRGFDVVHGPNFVVPPARSRPGGGRPVELLTIHDFGPWHQPDLVVHHARAYPRLVDRALQRGAHVHVVSSFVGTEAVEILGLDPARVHVIPNGIDPGPRGDPGAGWARIGGPYVITVGTVEPRKDLPTLVRAMGQVWEEQPDLRLVIVGPDGWGTAALESALAEVAARDRVVRLGYVPDAVRADLVAGAACLAFPSRYEGFGLPPLEAMAQATPVVAAAIGAVTEVCGDAALLVEPGDVAGLAEAIVAVVSDEALAARLIAAGTARLPLFSWDRAAADLAATYHRLADSAAA